MGLTGSSAFATACSLMAGTMQSFVRCAVLPDTAVFCCSVAALRSVLFRYLVVRFLVELDKIRELACVDLVPLRGMACPCTFLSLCGSCSWSCACRATNGLPPQRHQCTVGVLAGTHQCALRCQAGWHRGRSANPLWLLVLLCGRSRGVLVHSAFTCVLEFLQGRSNHPSDFGHKFVLRSRRSCSCEVHSVVIHGNDVAKICLRFPRLLNFLEFLGFLDILGVLALPVSLYRHPVEHPYVILENPALRRD